MMKAMGQEIPIIKKTLVINPENKLVQKYISIYDTDPTSEKINLFIDYMYEQALLLE